LVDELVDVEVEVDVEVDVDVDVDELVAVALPVVTEAVAELDDEDDEELEAFGIGVVAANARARTSFPLEPDDHDERAVFWLPSSDGVGGHAALPGAGAGAAGALGAGVVVVVALRGAVGDGPVVVVRGPFAGVSACGSLSVLAIPIQLAPAAPIESARTLALPATSTRRLRRARPVTAASMWPAIPGDGAYEPAASDSADRRPSSNSGIGGHPRSVRHRRPLP
jgi:hypothetical protein